MRIGRAEASPSSLAAIFRRSRRGTIEFSSDGGAAVSLQPELRDGPNSYNQGLAFDIGPYGVELPCKQHSPLAKQVWLFRCPMGRTTMWRRFAPPTRSWTLRRRWAKRWNTPSKAGRR